MKMLKNFEIPHTLILILILMSFAWLISAVVPQGSFQTKSISYQFLDKEVTKTILDSESFQYSLDEQGNQRTQLVQLFSGDGKAGFLNSVFDGLTQGDRNGGAVGVIAFLLLIGGSFGLILAPSSINKSMMRLLSFTKGKDLLTIPLFCLIFSLGGAVFGMGEEAIAFAMLLAPILISQGYNAITAVLCTYVSTQVGFATSWMNPFNVAVAQGLADVPLLSGAGFRFVMWCVFTLVLMVFSTRYASSIKVPKTAEQTKEAESLANHLETGDKLILANLFIGIIWVIWGVSAKGYYIAEIATQFLAIGLSSALITRLFKVDRLSLNQLANSFQKGASGLVPVALIVGFAQAILIILGGAEPTAPSALNTILHSTANSLEGFSQTTSAIVMLLFQSVFNLFVTSGSGQAALTMPLLAPMADLVAVSRQTAVLAFQLGDGLTNIIVPTSASLLGCLGVTGISWNEWAKFIWKFLAFNMLLATIFVVVAVAIGF